MTTANLFLVLHFVGLLMWIGGATALSWTAAAIVSSGDTKALSAVRSGLLAVVAPGILLAAIGGLARLVPAWGAVYAHAPWMHVKLTIGLVLGALHGVLVNRVRKAAAGQAVPAGTFVALAIANAALGLAAAACAILRFGQ